MEDYFVPPWWAMLQYLPEWSVSQQAYQPADGGWQSSQANWMQDQTGMLQDPALLALMGMIDPATLESSYEEVPGNSEGQRRVDQILAMSGPDSAEYQVALMINGGATPEQVDKNLQQLGIPQRTQVVGIDGEPVYGNDGSPKWEKNPEYERLMKLSTDLWSGRLADTPSEVKEVEHPIVKWAKEQGLPDPRKTHFTPGDVDAGLAGAQSAASEGSERQAQLRRQMRTAEDVADTFAREQVAKQGNWDMSQLYGLDPRALDMLMGMRGTEAKTADDFSWMQASTQPGYRASRDTMIDMMFSGQGITDEEADALNAYLVGNEGIGEFENSRVKDGYYWNPMTQRYTNSQAATAAGGSHLPIKSDQFQMNMDDWRTGKQETNRIESREKADKAKADFVKFSTDLRNQQTALAERQWAAIAQANSRNAQGLSPIHFEMLRRASAMTGGR